MNGSPRPFRPPSRSPRLAVTLPAVAIFGALCVLGGLGPAPARAQGAPGDLLVTPTRIVFEGRQRTAEITLVNSGAAPATYRISLIHLRMAEDGGTKEIEAKDVQPGERFVDELIRYSPRQVTLEPRVGQTIRMQLRKPAVLDAGEYRSHLLFRAVPTEAPREDAVPAAGSLSIQLKAIYGISIPIIVRHGETSAQARLSDLAVVPGETPDAPRVLRFRIHRTGSQSVYGNLTATYTPRRGKPLVVGLASGLAVYTPNAIRSGGLALRPPPGVDLRDGFLRLTYSKVDKEHAPMAEAEIRLP